MQHTHVVAFAHESLREQDELPLCAAVAEITDDEGDLHDWGRGV
jgi:hypothetical protein